MKRQKKKERSDSQKKLPFDYLLENEKGAIKGEAKRIVKESLNPKYVFKKHQLDAFRDIHNVKVKAGRGMFDSSHLIWLLFMDKPLTKLKKGSLSEYAKENNLIWRIRKADKIIFAIELYYQPEYAVKTTKIMKFIESGFYRIYSYHGGNKGFRLREDISSIKE